MWIIVANQYRPLFRGDNNKQAQIKPQLQSLSSIGPKVLDMAL